MDAAKIDSEIQHEQLETDLDALETLLQNPNLDSKAVKVQIEVVNGSSENYKNAYQVYKDLLLKASKKEEVKVETKKLSMLEKRRFTALQDWKDKSPQPAPTATPAPTTTVDPKDYRVKLPKRDIPKFAGDIRQWRSWEAAFSEIDKDKSIPDIEKYNYMLQYTVEGSPANKIVKTFPAAATSYALVKKEMEERFGRKDLLINVYVRDLVKVAIENDKDKKGDNFIDIITSIQSHILNLEQLGVTKDNNGVLLYAIVESCIPIQVLTRYLEGVNPQRNLADLMEFLVKEVRRREETALAQTAFSMKDEKKNKGGNDKTQVQALPTATNFMNVTSSKDSCGFCGKEHATTECYKAVMMTLKDKRDALKENRRCVTCLQFFHRNHKCRVTCMSCKKHHHTMLCPDFEEKHSDDNGDNKNNGNSGNGKKGKKYAHISSKGESAKTVTEMTVYVNKPEVLLETLMVYIYCNGQRRMIRIMIDGGSQSSYIKNEIAEELGLLRKGKDRVIHQVFGAVHSPETEHEVFVVEISGVDHKYTERCRFIASAVDRIATGVIAPPQGKWMEECENLGIPLIDSKEPSDIDMLVGNDIAPYLKVGLKSVLLPSGLVATESKVGWFLEGKVPGTERSAASKALVCIDMFLSDKEVANLWALEAIGIQDATVNKSREELEQAAMDHFLSTVKQEKDGRYEVRLPLIEGHPSLPDNRNICVKRLHKTTQDLLKDGQLEKYDHIFAEWKNEAIIEEVPPGESFTACHYMPHRPVFKENSTTTVRPVFDASARQRGSPSLNECLEKGPNLLELIPRILMGFRIKKVGVISDIRKAFLQIGVALRDRDIMRFLWWKDIQKRIEMVVYRHRRVVFGVSSSPFLLGAVIQHLLEKYSHIFPETSRRLRQSFYVDNCVTSLDSMEKAKQFQAEAQELMCFGQFDLRGWEYGPTDEDKDVQVLGLIWNTKADELSFNIGRLEKRTGGNITKRSVLSMSNSIFDPLGFLAPFVINLRMLFKKICLDEQKFTWDSALPEVYKKQFEPLATQVEKIKEVKIPRFIAENTMPSDEWTIHTFCDASKDAYACCIYLRISSNPVRVQLLSAKARVTPEKAITIPRAELMACLLGARLTTRVIKDMGLDKIYVYFWTDSTTALSWIKKTETVWSVFVNNRVSEIRQTTCIGNWRHIPGEMNPADLPSRGCSVEKYLKLRWWEGPKWLYEPEFTFPSLVESPDEDIVNSEKRKTVSVAVSQDKKIKPCFMDDLVRYGDWQKIVRILVYMKRFVRNKFNLEARKPCTMDEISVEDLEDAESVLIRYVQKTGFPKGVPTGRFICDIDDYKIKRIVTRLFGNTEFARPVVLPGSHPLVELLIIKEHALACHAGIQGTMSILREKYWIVNGRRAVRRVIHACAICRVHEARRCKVVEGPLPVDRTFTGRCFGVTGVDLAGPLYLKNGEKVWVVIFTCAVYRAVHLELVTSLSTDVFIGALRKFVARRGRPNTIYSDNGTNFVGCAKNMDINFPKVSSYAAESKILWKFNPPTAAWWGGWWERLIGIMKNLLRKLLGKRAVTLPELEIMIVEVESVMNERPLTYVSEDPNDLHPLKPSMFLRDLPGTGLPEFDVGAEGLRKVYGRLSLLRDALRRRFMSEYIGQLVHYAKSRKTDILMPGDVVLVEVENKKRIEWPMGIIVEVYPGRDGIIRTARIRTTHGEFSRPLQRLFPLEVRNHKDGTPNLKGKDSACDEFLELEEDSEGEREDDDCQIAKENVEPEPIVVTRSGRKSRKPDRFAPK